MRSLHVLTVLAASLALNACSTPPKPPTVDESTRRPVNSPQTLALQRCTGELDAARAELTELLHSTNRALTSAKALAITQAQACRQAPAAEATSAAPTAPAGNQVFVIPFAHASAALSLSEADVRRLSQAAASASLIVVRGRTNATSDSLSETELARRRAAAAADWLQKAGVAPQRIRVQWQGAGDGLAGLDPKAADQRRVEIELYTALPRVETLLGASS
jgi:outer membrane protein OmpA-like peptidoglycan-associated protein